MHNPSDKALNQEFMKGISPFIERGLLECFFADFLSKFTSSKANSQHLLTLRQTFKEFPFFAELHSRTWYKEKTFDFFRENDIGFSIIDLPKINGFAPYYPVNLNYRQYYKLYGRSPKWLAGDDKFLDYSYSDAELKKIIRDAVSMSVTSQAVIIIFANVAEGYAPMNAQRLKNIILSKGEGGEITEKPAIKKRSIKNDTSR
jgi:uncharacterized protein YecE (DUF72 family)